MKVVGIIGAGASGLCAARHVLASSGLTPVVWEQSADLGGTWRLSEEVGVDRYGLPVHSSMYQNLKCDLPKLMMAFPDFPFPEEGEDFAHHTVVLKYLEEYAEHYNLSPWIKYGHRVEKVSPVFKEDNLPPAWEVTVTALKDRTTTTTICDTLLICNGHFSVPSIPDITSIEDFKGIKIHSHDYREPTPYVGCRVLVLGGGPSGLDISLEVSSVADQVYLSHTFPVLIPSELPPNIRQLSSGVKCATQKGFVLDSGEFVMVDAIIYCTGYKYKFPFLLEDCGIQVENNLVKPVYKHIVNALYPSMGFIGIPSRIAVFPLIYYQVLFFLATVTGRAALPSAVEMSAAVEARLDDLRLKGRKGKEYHMMATEQWDYMEDLASRAGLDSPPIFRKKLLNIVVARLFLSFPLFKTYSYKLSGDGAIVEARNGQVLNTGWELTELSIKQLVRLLWRDFFRVTRLVGSLVLKSIFRFFKGE